MKNRHVTHVIILQKQDKIPGACDKMKYLTNSRKKLHLLSQQVHFKNRGSRVLSKS